MSKYNGYTETQARAYKKYMNDRAVVTVRMTKEEKRILEEKAKAEGKSINQYILDKCL
jgi:ribbon-helix-helix protein, copG family|nr:MAG TPA: NikA, BACTERIAL CONJUGATION, RELAXASE, DNA [Caudoviricetes sp.]